MVEEIIFLFIRIRDFKYFVKKKKREKRENDTSTWTEFKTSGFILKFRNIYDSRKSFSIRFIAGALMILTSIQLTSDKSTDTAWQSWRWYDTGQSLFAQRDAIPVSRNLIKKYARRRKRARSSPSSPPTFFIPPSFIRIPTSRGRDPLIRTAIGLSPHSAEILTSGQVFPRINFKFIDSKNYITYVTS